MKIANKKLGIIIGSIILGILIIVLVIVFLSKGNKPSLIGEDLLPDNLRFKEQYESLNGKKDDTNKEYLKVAIDENNPIVYKSDNEILDVLNKETAIVFFGIETDAWSRNIVEPLLQIAKDNGIEKIYYVNIANIRDQYKVEDGKAVISQKGTDSYYKILDFLGDKLNAYYVYDAKGKEYATNVSRLEAGTVIAVMDGKVKAYRQGTVASQKDPYVPLTSEEKNELMAIYQNLYEPINQNLCPSEGC